MEQIWFVVTNTGRLEAQARISILHIVPFQAGCCDGWSAHRRVEFRSLHSFHQGRVRPYFVASPAPKDLCVEKV
jgi:hypothetical protein